MGEQLADQAVTVATLVDLVRWRAAQQGQQVAYTFLVDGETAEIAITYAELDQRARAIASQVQRVAAAGQRALLLYESGLEYLAAFFGCLYAGVVAVPAYPPRMHRSLQRLAAIVVDAQATVALTTTPFLTSVQSQSLHLDELAALHWLPTDTIAPDLASTWDEPALERTTLAFLQYTSGSTAAPRGVMVTHHNLLVNSALIQQALQTSPTTRAVTWLPLYHDMGLIGGVVQTIYAGATTTLMSPIAFLQQPLRWLQAISRTQATISGGPNFAYELCVRKITPEQRATLDLRSWVSAFNGAEPVRPQTLERFVTAFAPCGFRREAFFPCYGLAEATLFVSGGPRQTAPVLCTIKRSARETNNAVVVVPATEPDSQTIAGCGQVPPEQTVVIVHPEQQTRCAPDQIGEIWLAGPSIAQGYWQRAVETSQTFAAYLADSGDGPFLRTGDLGFLQDGVVFVTGRLKDLIILRGRNYYPQDIELTAEQSHPALRAGCGAAFSVDIDGEERLVIVYELERHSRNVDIGPVAETVRQMVAAQHEVQVHTIVLLKPGTIPKTSSGKIQRQACCAAFLANSLAVVSQSLLDETPVVTTGTTLTRAALATIAPDQQQALVANYLRDHVARVLKVDAATLDWHTPLQHLVGDSLMAVELQYWIETEIGMVIPLEQLFQDTSIIQLAAQVLNQWAAGDESRSVPTHGNADMPSVHLVPDPAGQNAPFPLTPLQHAYWIGRSPDLPLGGVAAHYYLELDGPALDPCQQQ